MPMEHPKLMAVAQINEQGFAELLDRRLKRIEEAKLTPKMIEAPAVEIKPPLPRIPDRRYRRI